MQKPIRERLGLNELLGGGERQTRLDTTVLPSTAAYAEFATGGWGGACPRRPDVGYRRARVRTGHNDTSEHKHCGLS